MATQDLPENDPHRRPAGVDDNTVTAVGRVTEALETLERARGALYDFHQMIGSADIKLGEAADLLEHAGHERQAAMIRQDLIGRNVLEGRWTFQIVEEFDHNYWLPFRETESDLRDELLQGRKHIYESEMKEANRSKGRRWHEARP